MTDGHAVMAARTTLTARQANILAFAGLTLFYLATAPQNHAISIDPYFYARMITTEGITSVPHPRLMLWIAAMQALWQGASLLVPNPDPFVLIGALNAGLTALATLLLRSLLQRTLNVPAKAAWATALLFALSYGIWRYATEIEVYAATAAISLALLHKTFANPPETLTSRDTLTLAALGGLCALAYQPLGILPGAAIPLYLALAGHTRKLPAYFALSGTIVLAGFGLGAWLGDPANKAAVDFVLHTNELHPGVPGLKAAVGVAYGLGSDILSANWVFGVDRLAQAFRHASPDKVIDEEVYAALKAGWLIWVPVLTLPLIAATALALIRAGRARRPRPDARTATLATWFLLHAAMMTVLSPAGFEGWLLAVVPLSLLAGRVVIAPAIAGGASRWAAALVALFLVHNGAAGIAIQASPQGDYFRARGDEVIARAAKGDLIVMAGNWKLQRFLLYRTPANAIMASAIGVPATKDAIDRTLAAGGKVLILDDMVRPTEPVILRDPTLSTAIPAMTAPYLPRATRFATGDTGFAYELTGAAGG
jgi:hypothetical protein